ncbi:MAG: TonB-dependent receptor, partial [Gammaproteobacteria bacterium]|nr:TonB-dependent receptor [Gammaproteobacteria bacterium]
FREGFGNSPTYGPFDSSNPGYAVPILSAEQIAIVLDPSPVLLNDTNIDILDSQEDERFAFGFDVDFDMSGGGFLESIQFGIKYETVEMTRWWNRAKTDRNAMRPDGTYDPDFGRFTTGDAGIYDSGFTVPLGDIGAPLAPFGINGIPQVDRAVYEAMRDNFKRTFLEALNAGLVDYQSKKFRFVEEDILNAYIQGRFKFSDTFQVIAGVRFDRMEGDYESTTSSAARVRVTALDGNSASQDLLEPVPFSPGVVIPQELVFVSRSETEILPRIVATWRPDDNWVVRGAYTTAIARPNVSRISRIPEENNAFTLAFEPPTLATIDPDATLSDILALGVTAADLDDFAVEIDVGNPALDNTFSHNFDLSVEYYFNDVSAITAGLFFKRIENFVFDPHENDFTEGQFVTDPAVILADLNFTADGQALIDSVGGFSALLAPGTLELEIYQSENGRDADVFGIELGFATQFENLPAPWDGLGFFGNVTFLESEAETVFGTLGTDTGDTDWLILTGEANPGDAFVRKTDFFSQPDLIANAAIFYDKEGLEIALSYYYRGLQLHQLDDYGVDFWEQSTERWDFTFEYTLPWWEDTISVYFNARDFTDDGDKPTTHRTLGRGTRLPDILTFNGREFIFGISGRFGE